MPPEKILDQGFKQGVRLGEKEMSEEQKEEKIKEYTPRQRFFIHMAVGAVIGLGGVLPGVSGGVMAVSLGLYIPLIEALANFFKDLKKNFLFLLPVGIGAVVGFLLGAVVLSGVMERWYNEVVWLFLGLVAGGLPSFIKEANGRGFKKRYLIATALGAGLASILLVMRDDSANVVNVESLTWLQALISGAIVSVGTVFPGVSTSFILMYFGWYKAMMDAFANFEVWTVALMGLGAAGCFVATVKAARWLFDRFYGWAYYAVLGFLIVSAVLIIPPIVPGWPLMISGALAAVGAATAYMFGKLNV